MKTYSMKCPNCNANLTFYDSETQVTCLYCGGTVYREEESHSEDASMVKAILDKRAELKKAQNELEALTAKREQISKQYHMPPVNEVMDNLSDGCLSFALMFFPILTLLGAIMAIGEDHDVTLFIVFLVLTAILSPLFFRGMKKWKETDKRTSKTNAKDAEARKAFEEKKKADLNAIDSEITALKNRIIDLEKESVADWLPESVRSDSNRSEKALHFIYGEMTQNKGMTLKQAIKEYERRNFLS